MFGVDVSQFPAKAVHAAGALACVGVLGAGYLAGGASLVAGEASPVDLSERLHEAESDAALKAAAVERLEREVAHARAQLDDKPIALMPAAQLNRRLAELSGLAGEFDLTLASSQPGRETQLTYYAYLPITVGGDGRLADVVRFLGALHDRFPDMGVGGFDVTRDPLGGGQFTLRLNWFVQPSQTAQAL